MRNKENKGNKDDIGKKERKQKEKKRKERKKKTRSLDLSRVRRHFQKKVRQTDRQTVFFQKNI